MTRKSLNRSLNNSVNRSVENQQSKTNKTQNEMSKYVKINTRKRTSASKKSKKGHGRSKSSPRNLAVIDLNVRSLSISRLNLLKTFQKKGWNVHVFAPNALQSKLTNGDLETLQKTIKKTFKDAKIQFTPCNTKSSFFSLGPLKPYQKFESDLYDLLFKNKVTDLLFIHEEAIMALGGSKDRILSTEQFQTKTLILGKLYHRKYQDKNAQQLTTESTPVHQKTGVITGGLFLKWQNRLFAKIADFKWSKLRSALSKFTHVVVQNKEDGALIKSVLDEKRQTLILVEGAGVDLNHFAKHPLSPTTPLTFLFVGRLESEKGFADFCEAVQIVRKKYPGMIFNAIGELPHQKNGTDYEKMAKDSGIHHFGDVIDVRPYLHDAHVVVFPSHNEATSKALQEALAVGRPIITTNISGCAQSVTPKENGVVVHVKDPWAIANSMTYFIDQSEQLKKMADYSRKFAETKFDDKKIDAQIVQSVID